jgi:hypothetical protein
MIEVTMETVTVETVAIKRGCSFSCNDGGHCSRSSLEPWKYYKPERNVPLRKDNSLQDATRTFAIARFQLPKNTRQSHFVKLFSEFLAQNAAAKRGTIAGVPCEVCAARKIVLQQNALSLVECLLRCVLLGAAMQILRHSTSMQFETNYGIARASSDADATSASDGNCFEKSSSLKANVCFVFSTANDLFHASRAVS